MTPSDPRPVPADAAPLTPADRAALEAGRERAIQLLTDRFADDTLTVEEFEERLDRMYRATTPMALDVIVRDLVAPPPGAALAQAPRAPAYPSPDDRPPQRRLLAFMSETRKTGRWVVSRRLDVSAIMSDLFLDLRDAQLPPGLCEIDLTAVMANVKVLVPPGVIVEGLLTSVMAAVGNDAEDDGRLPANAIRVRLTGVAFMAEVRVRVAPSGEPPRQAWRHARRRG